MTSEVEILPFQKDESRNVVRFDIGGENKNDDPFFASEIITGVRPRIV